MESYLLASERFITHCSYLRSLSPNTTLAYRQDLVDFHRFGAPGKDLSSITREDVEAYVRELQSARALSPATAKRRLCSLKNFLGWACKDGLLAANPLQGLSIHIRIPRCLPRTITRRDLRKIIRVTIGSMSLQVSPTSATKKSLHVGVLLMAATGMRVAELVAITVGNVDIDSGRIQIQGKGARERTVFVTDVDVQRKLRDYIAHQRRNAREDDVLLVSDVGLPLTTAKFRRMLKAAAKAAGITRRVTPHMLRHTAATLLIEAGVDIRFVQRLLGHQSISTTEIYTHVTDVSLRAALRRADLMRNFSLPMSIPDA